MNKRVDKQIIVFDFDGVFVLDSDAVFKKEAWDVVLKPWAGQYETHLEEGNCLCTGQSGGRIKVLHYVLEQLSEPAELIPVLAEKFDNHVQKRMLKAGPTTGALEMLKTLSRHGIRMYLNSGTATPALQRAAKNLKIDHFFSEILGSTKEPQGGGKTENLQYIARRERVKTDVMLFVGDGESDYKAALEFGCDFVGFANKWNQWAEKRQPFPVITELRDVPNFANN